MGREQVTLAKVRDIKKSIKGLPPVVPEKVGVSKAEAVRELAKDIEALQRRGYSLEQIRDLLLEHGMSITPSTLRNYLSRSRASKEAENKTKRKDQLGGGGRMEATVAERSEGKKATFSVTEDPEDI